LAEHQGQEKKIHPRLKVGHAMTLQRTRVAQGDAVFKDPREEGRPEP
jgi:hypothetical protein